MVVEIRCGTEVVGLCVLKSSTGWLHCLSLGYNCPKIIARGWSMGEIAVVSTAMGVSPFVDAVKIN